VEVDGSTCLAGAAGVVNMLVLLAGGAAAVGPLGVGLVGWPVEGAVAWAYVCAGCLPVGDGPGPVVAPKGELDWAGAAPMEGVGVLREVDMVLMICGGVWGNEVFGRVAAWFCVVCVVEREWS